VGTQDKLKLKDVRRVFRLVGEVRERGDDPGVWRKHMIGRLLAIFRAQIAISSEVYVLTTARRDARLVVDIGWGGDSDGTFWKIESRSADDTPETYRLVTGAMIAPPRPDQRIPVTPAEPIRRGSTFLLSQYALPHISAVDHLGLHRAFGDQPFTPAEHRLVRLFHVELGRLWNADALRRARDPARELPPRLAQTLEHFASGASEKQIALALHLSPHTIHNYAKALHARLGVSSRGELLARLRSARQEFLPQLSLPVPDHAPQHAKNGMSDHS
jgi:DNA-binding CsgD family transcriptional regulator